MTMSALKLQPGLRCLSPQQKVYLCAGPASNNALCSNGGIRENGTISSPLPRGTNTGGQEKKQRNSNKLDKSLNGSENKTISIQSQTDVKGRSFSFGVSVPLKIAELNKYVTETSRRLIKTSLNQVRFSNSNNNSNSRKSDDSDKSSVYSLEKTVLKMNQSFISFYDTSCAKDSPHDKMTTQSNPQEVNDHNQSEVSRHRIPLFASASQIQTTVEAKKKKAEKRRAEKISRLGLETRTKALVQSLRSAHSLMSKLTRAEELCDHLIAHPECVWDAAKEKTIPLLLSLTKSPDKNLSGLAHQCLSLLGYAKPLTSPGIRILSIDGGGTRGLVAIEFLKALEKKSGKKIYELFDYVCGVSTGALLAVMICLYKLPLDRCEDLYKDCSIRTFTRNRVVGTTRLVWNHGFYDSQIWENILQTEFGNKKLIEFARENDIPQMSAVSSLMSAPKITSHLFRTYNPPYGVNSQYPGSCQYKIWEVIRASSAAPGYFEPFTIGDEVHEDGGIINNNPTALAIHESRLLWERENIHCVVSLGTGRFAAPSEAPAKISLKKRISTIVDSATDTEAVHYTLQDLLPARTYFRFNPYLSEEFFLDEIRLEKMAQMQHDAEMYTRRNSYKVIAAAERLVQERKPQQVIGDWIRQAVERI